jgi:flagella basal body P-ring formation protein FlgA
MISFRTTTLLRLLLTLVGVGVGAGTALGDSIVLKKSVRLAADATTVRLRDVAYLDGPEAQRYGDLALVTIGGEGLVEFDIEAVRAKLEAAGVRWSSVDLSGGKVTVRAGKQDRPVAMRGAAIDGADRPQAVETKPSEQPRDEFLVADALGARTPRGLIADAIDAAHRDLRGALRVAVKGADAKLLDDSSASRRYQLVPLTSTDVDTVRMQIVGYLGNEVVERTEITVLPTVETAFAVADEAIRRGQSIVAGVSVERGFVSPSERRRLLVPENLDELVAADAIKKGERVAALKVRNPTIIKKGEKVKVRRDMGGLMIELTAVAVADASRGELIELRVQDRQQRNDRKTFFATVTGPGEAMVEGPISPPSQSSDDRPEFDPPGERRSATRAPTRTAGAGARTSP